jgi:hypothetical protein
MKIVSLFAKAAKTGLIFLAFYLAFVRDFLPAIAIWLQLIYFKILKQNGN